MPWSNQTGGGGGGWKSGGSGPWGQRPNGGGGGNNQSPDLEEILRRGQDRIRQAMPGGPAGRPVLAIIALVLAAFVAFFGFTVRVDPDELGVVLRFGQFVRQLPPGLNFRWPYPIEQVFVPKVTRVNRVEVGVRGTGDSVSMPTSGRDVPEESLMLTGDENIVDVDFVVLWRIKDASKFLFNIQNQERTVKDVAESAMREIVGENDIQPILTQARQETELSVQKLMQKTLDSYGAGIEITQVQMQKVDPPQEVIDAFRDVQAAKADQERLQNEAQAYANREVPEARGQAAQITQDAEAYKEQTVAQARGQAARFLSVYGEYEKAPAVTRKRIFLETMENVFGNMDKIIVDSDKSGTGVVPYLPLNELTKPNTRSRSNSSSSSQGSDQ